MMPYSALLPVNGPETPKRMGSLEDEDEGRNKLPHPLSARLPVRAAVASRNLRRVVMMISLHECSKLRTCLMKLISATIQLLNSEADRQVISLYAAFSGKRGEEEVRTYPYPIYYLSLDRTPIRGYRP